MKEKMKIGMGEEEAKKIVESESKCDSSFDFVCVVSDQQCEF